MSPDVFPAQVTTVSVGHVIDFFGILVKAVGALRFVHVLSNLEANDKHPAKSLVNESSAVADEDTVLVRRAMIEAA